MKNLFNQGFSAKWIVLSIVILLIVIFGVFGFIHFLSKSVQQNTPAEVTTNGNPTEKITDLAPGVSDNQKTTITIMHADSSYEKFILPKSAADAYIKNLPTGDKMVSQTPSGN